MHVCWLCCRQDVVNLDKQGMVPLWEQGGWRAEGEWWNLWTHFTKHLCRRYFCPDSSTELLFLGALLDVRGVCRLSYAIIKLLKGLSNGMIGQFFNHLSSLRYSNISSGINYFLRHCWITGFTGWHLTDCVFIGEIVFKVISISPNPRINNLSSTVTAKMIWWLIGAFSADVSSSFLSGNFHVLTF